MADADTAIRRVRFLVLCVGALTALSVVLSSLPLTIVDQHGVTRYELALDWTRRLWLVIGTLPGIWVHRRPSHARVLAWSGWAIAVSFVLEWVTRGDPPNQIEVISPAWVQPVMLVVLLTLAALVVVIIPFVRLGTREPPGLPEARIHRD